MIGRFNEPRIVDSSSGAVSGEVRISYFDPITGEPRKTKPRMTKSAMEGANAQSKRAASIANARAKSIEVCGNPVIVDGVVYPSTNSTAKAVGCAGCTLANKLRDGATEYRGHAIRLKEDDDRWERR